MQPSRYGLSAILVLLSLPAAADPIADARTASAQLTQKLGLALKKELAAGGPEQAVTACRDIAPALVAELSRSTGGRVTRVSLRPRNPLLGQPDAWEQQVLLEFDARAGAGEKPETLEKSEIVTEPQGKFFRYMKALPVQPLCLSCHGDPATIADAVKTRLKSDYPHDRAIGYSVGQIRGAVSIRQWLGTAE